MVSSILQAEFDSGLVNFTSSFLNTLIEEFRILVSRLFHSDITAGKKESLKKLCLVLKLEICRIYLSDLINFYFPLKLLEYLGFSNDFRANTSYLYLIFRLILETKFDDDLVNSLSANHTKWSNTLKQFVGKNRRIA